MNLEILIQLLKLPNEYHIDPQQYLLLYFTVLGILVTLISITTSLTKEIRQNLIIKYYLKNLEIRVFIIWFVSTFVITYIFYFYESQYLDLFIYATLLITFLWTTKIAISFTVNLNRKYFYEKVINEFKKEVKQTKNLRKPNSELNQNRAQFKSIDDFIQNLFYAEMNNSDFTEETEALKSMIEFCISERVVDEVLLDFFNKDLLRVKNSFFFNKTISLLYELKFKYSKNLKVMRRLQEFLFGLIKENFFSVTCFDMRLNTSGLYLREFFSITYIDEFKTTKNEQWLQEYDVLLTNTINCIYDLCRTIISLNLDPKTKKKYLFEQLSQLNQILGSYEYLDGQELNEEYYALKVNPNRTPSEENDYRLAETKLSLIEEQKEQVKKKQQILFYLLLYNIDKEELTKDFFEMALKLFQLTEKEFYRLPEEPQELSFLNYDRFSGGAQSIAAFNFDKYRLLIEFYKYHRTGKITITEFEDENFASYRTLETELENLSERFILRYFDFETAKLVEFKKEAKKSIRERREQIDDQKRKKIINAKLNDEQVMKFKKQCKSVWEDGQIELEKFLKLSLVEGGVNIKNSFGRYELTDKEFFIDATESLDIGAEYGRLQTTSKLNHILFLINQCFDAQNDKTIIVKDLSSDLTNAIEKNQEYYLFYNSDLDVYRIPNLQWSRKGIAEASLTLNNSVVHFCRINAPVNLLFKKGAFSLKQYSKGYKELDESLVVEVQLLETSEINLILKQNPKYKSEDDVKMMATIRISEKFDVERNENIVLTKLII